MNKLLIAIAVIAGLPFIAAISRMVFTNRLVSMYITYWDWATNLVGR